MIKHTGIEIEEKGKVDRITLFLYLLFVVIGWFNIYAASYDLENATGMFDLSTRAGSQLIWIGTSLLIAFSLIKIEVSFYETYSFLFYLIGIFLLVVTLIVAQEINGSRSWLIIGPVRLQPAEFMKFIISLALAKVLNTYDFKLMDKKNLMLVSSIIILPTLLVIFQSETGTALVYLSLILVLYREGLPGGVLFMGIAAIIYFILGIRFSDEQIGMLSKGEIMTVVLIIIFSAGMVWSYLKRKRTFFIIILISSVPFLIALILYFFSETIDWGMFSLISLGVTALHLLYLFLRYRVKTYFYIFLFLIVSFGFLESTEYVFNDVLQPHQQMRIKVTLGMEQDLSGAGYHVGQSKMFFCA
jgi:rod shape determining protein RodA